MKKLLLIAIIIQLTGFSMYAQKFELKINAGPNITLIPDFENNIYTTNHGIIVPGIISPGNSVNTSVTGTQYSETSVKTGYFLNLEMGAKLSKQLNLSLSCGLNQMNFGYDSYIGFDYDPYVYNVDLHPSKLSEIDQNYGNTRLLFINLNPLNFTFGLIKNKLKLQVGPSVNFLINSNQKNVVIHQTTKLQGGEPYVEIDKLYFDSTTDLNKTIFGFQFIAEYAIVNQLAIFVSGQYYFKSIYGNDFTFKYDRYVASCKPIQISAGLSYVLWYFGKTKY